MENSKPKILFMDLETSNLKADFGRLLVFGGKWAHEKKPFMYSALTHPGRKASDDSRIVIAGADEVDAADILVTQYGSRFDIPFLQSRLLKAQKGRFLSLLPAQHVDIWRTVKYKLKLRNNRLATLIEFLELENEKTPIKGDAWIDAAAGDPASIKEVIRHCIPDVLALEEAYNLIRPLIDKHPRLNTDRMSCVACGSKDLKPMGWYVTTALIRRQRFLCRACGRYNKGAGTKMNPRTLA